MFKLLEVFWFSLPSFAKLVIKRDSVNLLATKVSNTELNLLPLLQRFLRQRFPFTYNHQWLRKHCLQKSGKREYLNNSLCRNVAKAQMNFISRCYGILYIMAENNYWADADHVHGEISDHYAICYVLLNVSQNTASTSRTKDTSTWLIEIKLPHYIFHQN